MPLDQRGLSRILDNLPPRLIEFEWLVEPLMAGPERAVIGDSPQFEIQHRLVVVGQVVDDVNEPGRRPGPLKAASRCP